MINGNHTQETLDLTPFSFSTDNGPEELDLSEFTDADILEEHCKACKLRKLQRKPVRTHFRRLV